MNMEVEQEIVTEENTEAGCPCKKKFLKKCDEVHGAWNRATARLKKDWKACCGNPFVRQTTVHKVEVFRTSEDQEPVDTFEIKHSHGVSARIFLMAVGTTLILSCLLSNCKEK